VNGSNSFLGVWSSCYNANLWQIRHILQINDMRNKLPILLALSLAVIAVTPWLRSLPWRQLTSFAGPTTVPPPNSMNATAGSDHSSRPLGEEQRVRAGNGSAVARVPAVGNNAIPAAAAPDRGKAQSLIDYAVLAVEGKQYISAQVSEEGELLGHPLAGVGRYYEVRQGPIPLIHLELTIEIDSVSTSMVQVCDNREIFWTYRKLPNGESLSKLDAGRAITALDQAAGRLPPGAMLTKPGLGGLGRLMRGLNDQFDFATATAEELDGAPVWKVAGAWRPSVLARLLPEQKDAAAKGRPYNLAKLPARLPDGVVVYLRQTDYFPLRIDYLRGAAASSPLCLLSLKFTDVSFRGPIDSGQFLFTPGSLEFNDRTDDFVRALGM
jgi:hypothetical protein